MRYHEGVSTADGFAAERSASLARLIADDAAGQLRRRDGALATLGSEAGAVKLDWVEGVPRLLADPVALETVETVDGTDPAALNRIVERLAVERGIVLPQGSEAGGVVDAALFEAGEGLGALHRGNGKVLRALLSDVLLIAVSMGMTSDPASCWCSTGICRQRRRG